MASGGNEVIHEITEQIAVISENASGWNKELNLVSWNNGPAKYDIRDWDPKHEKCGRGITLTEEEVLEIKRVLDERF